MKTNKTKTYKPYEVKPFTLTLKLGKKTFSRETVRRWDAFVFIREAYEAGGSDLETKMTVRGTNAVLDGLIADPKKTFSFNAPVLIDGAADDYDIEIKWAGAGAAKRGRPAKAA